jgi:ATP-binding cassette subfamily F protein 3
LEKTETEELLHLYSDKLHQFEEAGGYNIEHQTEEVLQGIGFANADLKRPYKEFSGGWRMRVLLAKMILQQPDLLLLDEPTNHLDLPSIEWLEKYLVHYKGAVVMVSHDKYFLNRMVKKTVELYQKELHIYNGNYSFYETEKAQRIDLQQRAFENQQDYIRQQERFVERFKAKASKAAQAQSIVKRLDRLDRIENVELERPNIRINFSIDKIPGRVLVELKNISKKFNDVEILKNASAEIDRNDKIALIGANGKGKSTLLRIIAGTESFEGERKWGHNVDDAFFAQHQLEALNLNETILDEMKNAGSNKTELELRTLLGCFLFSGDDSDKKIKILSGGEKARVALAKTIVSKANFLLLDEPTNHLDIHSTELLVDALNRYQGSIILVSHDRYFISKTANKIWEIVDHQVKEFKGGYEEWMEWKERMAEASKKHEIQSKKIEAGGMKSEVRSRKHDVGSTKLEDANQKTEVGSTKANLPVNKNVQKDLQKQQRLFKNTEEELAKCSEDKKIMESKLSSPEIYTDKEKFRETEKKYKDLQSRIDQLNKIYEEVFEKIIELEGK